MKGKLANSIFVLLALTFIFSAVTRANATAQVLEIRELELGDYFVYEEDTTIRHIEFNVTQEAAENMPYPANIRGKMQAITQYWDVVIENNDSSLISGFPSEQNIDFPDEWDVSLELAGDLHEVNYTYANGLLLITATQYRDIEVDLQTHNTMLYNVTCLLNHAIRERVFTIPGTITDYLSYEFDYQGNESVEDYYFMSELDFSVLFENYIEISSIYTHPEYGGLRINITQTFTFLNGSLWYREYNVNTEDVWQYWNVHEKNYTLSDAGKGKTHAVVSIGQGIPDEITYYDDQGFYIINPYEQSLFRGKVAQQKEHVVKYILVEDNIRPRRRRHHRQAIEEITSVGFGLFGLMAIPLMIYMKKRK